MVLSSQGQKGSVGEVGFPGSKVCVAFLIDERYREKKRKIEEEGTNVRKKLLRSVPLTKKNLRFDLVVGRRYLEKL